MIYKKKRALKKKKTEYTADEEFESCIAHLRDIVEELESSNFTNIREILGMNPTMDVERAVGTIVALAGSTKREEDMPSNCQKFYRQRKRMKEKIISPRKLHEELKEDGFYPRFLSNLKLFGENNPEQPPT